MKSNNTEIYGGANFSGWMHKQGSMIRSWKRRFFILRGAELAYYDTARITAKTKRKGQLKVITVESDPTINNGILIHGAGGRILKVYTESVESFKNWVAALEFCHASSPTERKSSRYSILGDSKAEDFSEVLDNWEGVDSNSNSSDGASIASSQTCGYLHKEGKLVKSWKRRYFTLNKSMLSYFDSAEMGITAKGRGKVMGVSIWEKRPFSLKILFEHGRELHVSADSQQEINRWHAALMRVVEERDFRESRTATYQVRFSEDDAGLSASTLDTFTQDINNQLPADLSKEPLHEVYREKHASPKTGLASENSCPDIFVDDDPASPFGIDEDGNFSDTSSYTSSYDSDDSIDLDDGEKQENRDHQDDGVWI